MKRLSAALLLAGVLCILAAFCLDASNPLPDAPGRGFERVKKVF